MAEKGEKSDFEKRLEERHKEVMDRLAVIERDQQDVIRMLREMNASQGLA